MNKILMDKNVNLNLRKVFFFIFAFGIFIGFVYLVSAVQEISLSLENELIQDPDELTAVVTFGDFGNVPTDVSLTFIILDESGIEYAVDKDFIFVTTEEVFRKKFEALFLPEGKYTLVLQTLYNVYVSDEFRQEFEIGKKRTSGITGMATRFFLGGNGKWSFGGVVVVILVAVLVLVLINEYKRKNEKKSKNEDIENEYKN